MKLEEGMYVRTKEGYIDKVLLVEYAEERRQKYPSHPSKSRWRDKILLLKAGYWRTRQNIIKASHNIIDLIEVGDYVNGWRVNGVEREEDGTFLTIGTLTNFVSRNETNPYLTQDYNEADRLCKIKSIVTKEQFESIEYKVEE